VGGAEAGCCPELEQWNVTMAGQSSSGSGTVVVAVPGETPRRLQGSLGEEVADPFAMEHTGREAPGGANRRPKLDEMIRQHASRLGVDASDLLNRTRGPRCAVPAWLNGTEEEVEASASSAFGKPGGSATKEPEVALKWIYKFNPLHGFLAEGANACGSWAKWCCVCHAAQRRIACLPEEERSRVDFFLTEDCCESKLAKNTSSPGFVVDATPPRNATLAWRPGAGWVELAPGANDSYSWVSDVGPSRRCAMVDIDALPAAAGLLAATAPGGGRQVSPSGEASAPWRGFMPGELLVSSLLPALFIGLFVVLRPCRTRGRQSPPLELAGRELETVLSQDAVVHGSSGWKDVRQADDWGYSELS